LVISLICCVAMMTAAFFAAWSSTNPATASGIARGEHRTTPHPTGPRSGAIAAAQCVGKGRAVPGLPPYRPVASGSRSETQEPARASMSIRVAERPIGPISEALERIADFVILPAESSVSVRWVIGGAAAQPDTAFRVSVRISGH
jgi:hypothetical protein